jgi:hypothetical protein
MYYTGNIHNGIIQVLLYQSTVTCMHKFRLFYSTTYNAIPKVLLCQSTVTRMHKFRLFYSTTYNAIPNQHLHLGLGLL